MDRLQRDFVLIVKEFRIKWKNLLASKIHGDLPNDIQTILSLLEEKEKEITRLNNVVEGFYILNGELSQAKRSLEVRIEELYWYVKK